MSIDKFRFVSPGVFISEVDESILPSERVEMGPVIVGAARKGPMMRPVMVQDYESFVQIFGEPIPGGIGGDIWRDGNKTSPTYGAYAAQAYLKNSGPVTFLRLGGFENPNKSASTTPSAAGWSAKKAYGVFVMPTSQSATDIYVTKANTTASLSLAAIIYTTTTDTTVKAYGLALSGSNVYVEGTGSLVRAGTDIETNVYITKGSNPTEKFVINFNPDSKKYIRNVLNTNPILTNTDLVEDPSSYFLGESFASFVKTINSGSISGDFGVCVLELGSANVSYTNFNYKAKKAETGWIYSQHLGKPEDFIKDANGNYPVEPLFKFESLSEGSWNNENIKISIEDIKASPNVFEPYGSFTVSVRKVDDNDSNPMYLERFSNVSLNPGSPDFIAKKIGDKYTEWDYIEKRYKEFGTYDNKSKYIRVAVHDNVLSAQTNASLLPYGFYLNKKYVTDIMTADNSTAAVTASVSSFSVLSSSAKITASVVLPEIPVLKSTDDSGLATFSSVYWGLKTNLNNTKRYNKDVTDFLRSNPVSALEASSVKEFFSLDEVSASAVVVADDTYRINNSVAASWVSGSRKDKKSLTSLDYKATDGSPLILSQFNKFTVPLVGGFDGVNIFEKDPFNKRALEGKDETTSYAYNSVKVAVEAVTNPDFIEGNLAVMPGVENKNLTSLLIEKCEQRGDMLAIVDLEGDYTPEEGKSSASQTADSRRPNVSDVIRKLNERALNSSYGCAFFPWVLIRDSATSNLVWVPPSIAALGTFSSSQKQTAVWFAPAGFNRGGLSNGSAGLPVVQASLKLTSKERDRLYEANINPIATFPSEGIVVFGQKTLQVTRSALDRINVRRLMIYIKKEISRMATTVLFDPNVEVTWKRFLQQADPFLKGVQTRFGITEYKLVLDNTTTTPDLVDRNIVYAKVLIKPTRAIEFFAIDFVIASSGATFSD